jgi:DNA-binding NarL/FixJ family response regulator
MLTRECRVIVADGHPEMHRIISDILGRDFQIVAAVQDGESLVVEENRSNPTLIIADVRMPRMSGLRAWEHIRRRNPQCKIIFLSTDNDEAYRMAAIEADASGWIIKTSVSTELLAAVHCVLEGGLYLTVNG